MVCKFYHQKAASSSLHYHFPPSKMYTPLFYSLIWHGNVIKNSLYFLTYQNLTFCLKSMSFGKNLIISNLKKIDFKDLSKSWHIGNPISTIYFWILTVKRNRAFWKIFSSVIALQDLVSKRDTTFEVIVHLMFLGFKDYWCNCFNHHPKKIIYSRASSSHS